MNKQVRKFFGKNKLIVAGITASLMVGVLPLGVVNAYELQQKTSQVEINQGDTVENVNVKFEGIIGGEVHVSPVGDKIYHTDNPPYKDTDKDGIHEVSLNPGIYNVTFKKDGMEQTLTTGRKGPSGDFAKARIFLVTLDFENVKENVSISLQQNGKVIYDVKDNTNHLKDYFFLDNGGKYQLVLTKKVDGSKRVIDVPLNGNIIKVNEF